MSRKERNKIPRPIAEKIGAMRRGVIRFFLVDGLNRLLLALLVWCAVDFAIDIAEPLARPLPVATFLKQTSFVLSYVAQDRCVQRRLGRLAAGRVPQLAGHYEPRDADARACFGAAES